MNLRTVTSACWTILSSSAAMPSGRCRTPGLSAACGSATVDLAFPFYRQGRHPRDVFRGSIGGPPVPLSTLRPRSRQHRRMTRGQRGSLLLHCGALSSPTPRRFIPALSDRARPYFVALACRAQRLFRDDVARTATRHARMRTPRQHVTCFLVAGPVIHFVSAPGEKAVSGLAVYGAGAERVCC